MEKSFDTIEAERARLCEMALQAQCNFVEAFCQALPKVLCTVLDEGMRIQDFIAWKAILGLDTAKNLFPDDYALYEKCRKKGMCS